MGEGQNTRMNIALRRRLMGPWRYLTLAVFIAATALWAGGFAVLMAYDRGPINLGVSWLIYAVVAVGGATLARRRQRRAVLDRWRDRGSPAAQVLTFAVEDAALVVSSQSAETRVLWPYVSEIAPAAGYWLLPVAGQTYFLPRRFFETPQAEIDFLAALLARMPVAARERSAEARKLTMFA